MQRAWFVRAMAILGLIGMQFGVFSLASAEPNSFNDPNMQIVWERTDKPVEMFVTQRSYMWGPNTLTGSPSTEPYAEAPGGNRTVQYFDKSRMEVNNPNGDRSNLFFITNGLLVREMVSGQLQLGDSKFQPRLSALEAVAGDPATANPNAPTYTTFKPIASLNNNNPSTNKVGQPVTDSINKAGAITPITSPDPSVVYSQFDTTLKHNIANVFVDFLNQTGPIFVNGQIVNNQQVINGVFLAGLPITEAYWTKAKVGGVEKDVLVQLFERRVLTYTPSNPAGFKVEMGNVGQHYLRWRYGTNGVLSEQRIIFQSNRDPSGVQIFSMKTDGSDVKQLTTEGSNIWARWSPDNRIVFVSDRLDGEQVWVMNYDGTNQQKITSGDIQKQRREPEWSADGSRIFYVESDFTIMEDQIFSIAGDGSDVKQLTNIANTSNLSPRASPDGKKVAFSSHNNNFTNAEVFKMNPDGTNQTDVSQNATGLDTPTDWKGNTILFQVVDNVLSTKEVWSMNPDGANKVKISGPADSEGAYSPDAQRIAFTRDEGAGSNLYVMKADGTGATKLTNTTGFTNRLPDWSN